MSAVLKEVLEANDAYASSFGDKSNLALPPARRFAILTCMDARLDPAKYAGLSEGDAHVIRNAGGRASDDAIRSLVISYKVSHELLVYVLFNLFLPASRNSRMVCHSSFGLWHAIVYR